MICPINILLLSISHLLHMYDSICFNKVSLGTDAGGLRGHLEYAQAPYQRRRFYCGDSLLSSFTSGQENNKHGKYRINRFPADAISTALHSVFRYLESKNRHIRMLFVDFSSAFNTISSMVLIGKLTYRAWVTPYLNIGFPHKQTRDSTNRQSHLLYVSAQHWSPTGLWAQFPALHTHDCSPRHQENSIVKYAHDTTIIIHIIL